MAIIIGKSGAYRGVLETLTRVGLTIESLDQITPLRMWLVASRETIVSTAAGDFDLETVRLRGQLGDAERAMQEAIANGELVYSQQRVPLLASLEAAEAEHAALSPLIRNIFPVRKIVGWWHVWRRKQEVRKSLARLDYWYAQGRRAAEVPALQCQARLRGHLENRENYIRWRVQTVEEQLACVSRLQDEGEIGGAAGELEVIEQLRSLSDEWVLLNDVNLTADRWYRFNRQNLMTAQLDHVLVGPGGIFVIETKNWSRSFVEKGEFFSPYEQNARGAFLCHKVLKLAGLPCRTRGIIATRTRLPEKPGESHAKVLRPEQLRGYVCWFKPEMEPGQVAGIVSHLQNSVKR